VAESDFQRDWLLHSVSVLDLYFADRPDIYVSGNLLVYYERGKPSSVVAPDVFVICGVPKRRRRIFKVWEEGGKTPDMVIEITSDTTRREDEVKKPALYSRLGVHEYFQYDPTGDYLRPALKGRRLDEQGDYQPISPTWLSGDMFSLTSEILGLELRLEDGQLRFFEPSSGTYLLSHAEERAERQQAEDRALAAEDRALAAEDRALAAEDHAGAAEDRALAAEDRNRELEAEVARLRKLLEPDG
jgi:Uma2 family endonuclease